ncbi:MAG: amidohydrolase [Anaerolineales bacterium]|nr:amidohydrolase [Anaerolineales bacterium]
MFDLLIQNCNALVPENGRFTIRHAVDIGVKGDRIAAIEPTQPDPPATQQVVVANGQLAIPGLMNTHAHAPMVVFRGLAEDVTVHRWFNDYIWPLESNLTPEDVYWGMQLALAEMIENGVTTVADHYFFMDEAAEAVVQAGTRAALGWTAFGSHGKEGLEKTAVFAQKWHNQANGRITTWMAPHAPYTCDDDFLRAAVAHARQLGIGIHIHAAEEMSQTESSLAKRGQTPIQVLAETGILDLPTIIAHGCGIIPADIPLLQQAKQVGVAHAPKTYLKLGSGLTPIPALRQAGIPIGLATDGAASNNTLDILESMRLMVLLQKHEARDPEVMPLHEVLDIAFHGSAAVVGLGEKIGRLQPGYLADIVLIDMDGVHQQPRHSLTAGLVYNTRAGDVQTVVVNGRLLLHNRRHLTLDKAQIIREVQKSMTRLAQRVPSKRIQVYNP